MDKEKTYVIKDSYQEQQQLLQNQALHLQAFHYSNYDLGVYNL